MGAPPQRHYKSPREVGVFQNLAPLLLRCMASSKVTILFSETQISPFKSRAADVSPPGGVVRLQDTAHGLDALF